MEPTMDDNAPPADEQLAFTQAHRLIEAQVTLFRHRPK